MTDGSYRDDFEALMEMARDKTAAGRSMLASAMGDLFSQTNDVLTDQERNLVSGILRDLIHDAEMSIRRDLANKLASLDNIPHDLIVALANDEIEVAQPILLNSELLYDADLIEIIRHRTLQHQLSIAMRRTLGESVTDLLVETGDEDVIKTLLENANARISKATMDYLVEESRRVDSYQNPILRRPDLDPDIAYRMYWWVSAALQKHVLDHFDIDPTRLDEALDSTVTALIAHESEPGTVVDNAEELAQRMIEAGEITVEVMIRILRQGEVPLFETLFSKHTGLRRKLVQRILFEPGGEALAVACRGIGVPKDDFATIFMLTRKARFGEQAVNPTELSRVLTLFDRIQPEPAQAMLSRWQRDPEYLNAVRLLSNTSSSGGRTNGASPAGKIGDPEAR